MMQSRAAALVLVLAPMVGGCVQNPASFPSLAPRATEKVGFDAPEIAASVAPAADPALDAKLQPVATQLQTLVAGFDVDLARARLAAGIAGSRHVGSEAWIAAQSALAGLDDRRAQAGSLTTDLDALASDRVAAAGEGYPPLEALRDRAAAETERETAAIAALSATLPNP